VPFNLKAAFYSLTNLIVADPFPNLGERKFSSASVSVVVTLVNVLKVYVGGEGVGILR
jgi:hypothetical protein